MSRTRRWAVLAMALGPIGVWGCGHSYGGPWIEVGASYVDYDDEIDYRGELRRARERYDRDGYRAEERFARDQWKDSRRALRRYERDVRKAQHRYREDVAKATRRYERDRRRAWEQRHD